MITKEILMSWMLEDDGTILQDPLHPGVFSGYVNFTMDRIDKVLENNTHNRKIGRKTQLPALCEAIEANLWDDNVAKINFDKDGVLSDGQHRLFGAQRAEKPIRCLVTFGLEKTAQLVTDRRGMRSLKDDLDIAGYKDTYRLAAIGRYVYAREVLGVSVYSWLTRSVKTRVTPDALILKFIGENSERILEMVKRTGRMYEALRWLNIDKAIVNALVYEFDNISYEDATTFWFRLAGVKAMSGEDGDPIDILQKRLKSNLGKGTSKIPKEAMAALIIKAWNLYEKGERVSKLQYTPGGSYPEKFPEIFNPYTED